MSKISRIYNCIPFCEGLRPGHSQPSLPLLGPFWCSAVWHRFGRYLSRYDPCRSSPTRHSRHIHGANVLHHCSHTLFIVPFSRSGSSPVTSRAAPCHVCVVPHVACVRCGVYHAMLICFPGKILASERARMQVPSQVENSNQTPTKFFMHSTSF
jgi:hypothetical protein